MNDELIPSTRGKSLDDQLIELASAGHSPEKIAEHFKGAITPARVRVKVHELLKEGDWLTEAQKEQALIRLLHMNVTEMRGMILNEANAKLQLAYIKELLDRLDKRGNATEHDLTTYKANVGRALGRVVDRTLSFMRGGLSDVVPSERWDALMGEAMTVARRDIAAKQVE